MHILARFELDYIAAEKLKSLELTEEQKNALVQAYGRSYLKNYSEIVGDPRLMLSLVDSVVLKQIIYICNCQP